ncbi:hypothetical protein HDU76_007238 [Blyttiomyces sp. JEL0837]|nr:hypothetical protein HDU76_007238 [Blyttiomyces sp. JEL0837]
MVMVSKSASATTRRTRGGKTTSIKETKSNDGSGATKVEVVLKKPRKPSTKKPTTATTATVTKSPRGKNPTTKSTAAAKAPTATTSSSKIVPASKVRKPRATKASTPSSKELEILTKVKTESSGGRVGKRKSSVGAATGGVGEKAPTKKQVDEARISWVMDRRVREGINEYLLVQKGDDVQKATWHPRTAFTKNPLDLKKLDQFDRREGPTLAPYVPTPYGVLGKLWDWVYDSVVLLVGGGGEGEGEKKDGK